MSKNNNNYPTNGEVSKEIEDKLNEIYRKNGKFQNDTNDNARIWLSQRFSRKIDKIHPNRWRGLSGFHCKINGSNTSDQQASALRKEFITEAAQAIHDITETTENLNLVEPKLNQRSKRKIMAPSHGNGDAIVATIKTIGKLTGAGAAAYAIQDKRRRDRGDRVIPYVGNQKLYLGTLEALSKSLFEAQKRGEIEEEKKAPYRPQQNNTPGEAMPDDLMDFVSKEPSHKIKPEKHDGLAKGTITRDIP